MDSRVEMPSETGYAVRRGNVTDALQISLLYKRVWDEFESLFPKKLKESRQPSEEEMKSWMTKETYFIAEVERETVGVVGCRILHSACQLVHMVVDRPCRGKGIGTALARTAIDFARENNSFKVWLDTIPIMKEAKALYEKLGFVKCGYLRRHLYGLDIELYELVLVS
ncbi:MAG: GNAT family N-acetyltransferase [Candidatus Thorarchaeota archaeon]|nr:GNAT family N-acetyltransferase [Candidatus Thorarchaeota archaeon]